MKNIRIQNSLTAAIVLLIVMILAIGVLAISAARNSLSDINELAELSSDQVAAANRMEVNLMELRLRMSRFVDYVSENNADADLALEQARRSLERAVQRYEELSAYDVTEDQTRYPYYIEVVTRFQALVTPDLSQALADGNPTQIAAQEQRFDTEAGSLTDATREFARFAESLANNMQAEAQAANQRIIWTVAAVLLISLLLMVGLQIGLRRFIVSPLSRAVTICENIAQGDLTSHIEDEGRNEIGKLYQAMHSMQIKLTDMIVTLNQTSQMVAHSAREIASGSEDLASRTEEQASALQETASSMEEMSSTVSHNNQTASTASELTSTASSKASDARKEVEQTTVITRQLALLAN